MPLSLSPVYPSVFRTLAVWACSLSLAASLSGCLLPREKLEIKPEERPASLSVFGVPRLNVTAQTAESPQTPAHSVTGENWWSAFQSTELDRLMDRALIQNPDIRIALNRIIQLKARYQQASAGKKPALTAPIVAANQAPGGVTVGTAPSGQPVGERLATQKTFQASIRADWRLDLWGEQSALSDAAEFQLQRALHERDNVQRNLTATVAAAYIDLLSLNDRLRIAAETEQNLKNTLATLEKRLQLGDATRAEVAQQQAMIYSLQATIPVLEQQRFETLSQLAALTATPGHDLKLSEQGLDTLQVPPVPTTGINSSSLLARPDVRVAEAQLLAAKADIDVARARLLPSLDLSSQWGSSSTASSTLFMPGTLFWNVVANLGVSLFDGGRRQGEHQFSQAVKNEMVESYARTIYQGLRETENALSAVNQMGRKFAAHQAAADASQQAWAINQKIFDMGSLDYLSLLDTQRSFNRYLDELQRTRAEFLKSGIPLQQIASFGPPTTVAPPDDLATDAPDTQSGTWAVEFEQPFHDRTLPPFKRHLQAQFPDLLNHHRLQGQVLDRVNYKTTGTQHWYQVRIAGFDTQGEASGFCEQFKPQLPCKIIPAVQ